MDYQRNPKPGEIYKHFKDKLYQIITVATHTETHERLVIYQALYGDYKIFARPLDMFLTEVDHNKYPGINQTYRFELYGHNYTVESIENSNKKEIEAKEIENKEIEIEEIEKKEVKKKVIEDKELDESGVNSVLLQFLDAKSYNDKLAVMMSKRKSINDRLLNDMAVSIDCTIEEGTIEERIKGLIFALETLARFENKRLR